MIIRIHTLTRMITRIRILIRMSMSTAIIVKIPLKFLRHLEIRIIITTACLNC
jgi:hypothetical protein